MTFIRYHGASRSVKTGLLPSPKAQSNVAHASVRPGVEISICPRYLPVPDKALRCYMLRAFNTPMAMLADEGFGWIPGKKCHLWRLLVHFAQPDKAIQEAQPKGGLRRHRDRPCNFLI